MKAIRIMSIIGRLNIGGPAVLAISLTRIFSRGKYRSLLVCGRVDSYEGDMSYLAREQGVRPLVLPELGREISPWADLKKWASLRGVIKGFRPHIIHTHTAKAGTLGRFAAISLNIFRKRRDRIRLVHTFHGHFFHSYFGHFKTVLFLLIERFLARFTDRIVVISPAQQRDIGERYRVAPMDKISIIPLGFHLEPFVAIQEKKGELRERFFPQEYQDKVIVGLVGRLTSVKNHRMFLKSIRRLKYRGAHEPLRFVIVGDGELKEELIQYAGALEIEDLVVFLGWQRDMPPLYHAMDIVALTSNNEGTPVTLIEAMASGRIAVATDVGGVRDLFGALPEEKEGGFMLAQNGFLIPPGRSDLLAECLIFIIENQERAEEMGREARDFVLRRYGIERLQRDLENLYSDLLKNSGST